MSSSLDVSTPRTDATIDAVVEAIADATTDVREAIATERRYAGTYNPSGEEQLGADVHADRRFEERMLGIEGVGSYASEEREEVVEGRGDYHVAMDPLDGSSNLEPNSGMGTIFGVYRSPPPTSGRDLLAAGFVVYGPTTSVTVAREDTVREYVVHDGETRLVEDDLEVPSDPTVYGFGGGVDSWRPDFREFAGEVREELKLRYGGAMIADVNQVLKYGGLFSYPGLQCRPEGKLRLQFEGQPMGYVVEAAGGRSSNGERSLLDVEPDRLHERTPLHLGSPDLVGRLESTLS